MALFRELPEAATAFGPVATPPVEVALAPGLGAHDAAATTRDLVRRLELGGWQPAEAGNLVGLLYGLRPATGGWSVHEIEHLRFIRTLVEAGTLER